MTVNTGSSTISKTIDLRTFSSLGQVETFRTSSREPHTSIESPTLNGNQLTFEFPSRSVTTFKISAAISSSNSNLILNGDFESTESDAWFTLYGARADNGINGYYVRRGRYSGFIDYNDSELSLMQNVIIPQSKTYYLSAWCATSGPNTVFGILINGKQGPELKVNSNAGYQLYGLSIDAQESDVLSIYIYSQQGDHSAQIDDVQLH